MHRKLYHINITKQCQLNCTHCYIPSEIRKNTDSMHLDKMREIADLIADTAAEVHIIGGEPTLVNIETHKAYLKILKPLKNTTIALVTALQNNRAVKIATLYDSVYLSYDPNARFEIEINQWMERVNQLRACGINLQIGISMSKSVIKYGIIKALDELQNFGFKSIHLAAMVPTDNAIIETPDPRITSNAFIESAKWAMDVRKNGKEMFVTPFDGLMQNSTNGYDGLICPASQSSVNLMPTGAVSACVTKNISKQVDIGTVGSEIKSNKYVREVMRHKRPRLECLDCDYWKTCQGGCRILANSEIAKKSTECAGFKVFLNYVSTINDAA